jgi:hypothetical protein
VSPDFDPQARLQENNAEPWRKIQPRKSWEIARNKLGSTPPREPKTAANDDQPLLAVHLIDGDAQTAWCSRGQPRPDVQPEWIRLDLPVERSVNAVVLRPHPRGMGNDVGPFEAAARVGQALPGDITVKVSCDGWHWETVHHCTIETGAQSSPAPRVLSFKPRQAKQVWIVGTNLIPVLNFGHCFSIGSVEVLGADSRNLALISRGAGVTVSSTHTGYGMDRFTQEMLWPIQYDLGYKWARVGYDMGAFTWMYVEREKGKLAVDARADQAITEAVANGVNIIMCLDKGNWLYAPNPKNKDRTREIMDVYFDRPPEPYVNEKYLGHYLDYVRYMVRHFKDRVAYYEIMNEWFPSAGTPQDYCKLAKAAIAVIREEYPGAKIMPASPGDGQRDFILDCLREGLGPMIDAIGFHPFYHQDVLEAKYVNYPRDVRNFKKLCQSYGFKGEFMATEWTWGASYPVAPWGSRPWGRVEAPISELSKAKYAAQLTVRHVGLDMVSLWNETFQTNFVHWSISLVRNTFSSDPIVPTQPEVIYYVQRTLATALAEVDPADLTVRYSLENAPFETWTFRRGDERLAVVWRAGVALDGSVGTASDIILVGVQAKWVAGIDTLNGREQRLNASVQGNDTVLKAMLLGDCPIVLRFQT